MNERLYWFKLLAGGLIWLVSQQQAVGQVGADAQKRYKAAVRLVQTGDYDRAKSELNVIIQRDGPLAPYAHYYYSIAAFRQRYFGQSRLMLKQLMNRYPDWRKMDEARYLFGAVCMETGQFEDGLTEMQRIGDPVLRADVTKLERHFIGQITDLNRLRQMNREFPEDRIIGLALIDLIQRSSSDKEDLELSDRLTNRFGVPVTASSRPTTIPASSTTTTRPTPATPQTSRPTRAKGYYNVAVMFPFRLEDFDADKRLRANQYVYDLYNGIKLAKDKLQEEGITVNLFAYDVDNDANKTLELVNSPAFAQTDLIIGPLYVEPNRIASAFANQNNVLLLNPIATSSELVANQPMSFLAQPSLVRQAQRVVEQARNLGGGRKAAIYFGATRKDSLLAVAYQTELKRLNYQIVDFRKLTGSTQAIADAMQPTGPTTTTAVASASASIPLSHIFLSSSNDDDGPRLLDALSRRRVTGPVLATAAAFDFYKNSLSTFTRRDLYLLYPDFIDTSREPVTAFQEQYLEIRNTIPSVFASQGYDMMLFFGRQLAKNGPGLRNRTSLRSDTDDYLLSGFDYTQNNENQIVPIVKYDGGRFVKIN
ncbi:amino acid ABC transporter substrate-binding protein [Spirosoma fluminis]